MDWRGRTRSGEHRSKGVSVPAPAPGLLCRLAVTAPAHWGGAGATHSQRPAKCRARGAALHTLLQGVQPTGRGWCGLQPPACSAQSLSLTFGGAHRDRFVQRTQTEPPACPAQAGLWDRGMRRSPLTPSRECSPVFSRLDWVLQVAQKHAPERRTQSWLAARAGEALQGCGCLKERVPGPQPAGLFLEEQEGTESSQSGMDLGQRKSLTDVCLVQNDGFHQTTHKSLLKP